MLFDSDRKWCTPGRGVTPTGSPCRTCTVPRLRWRAPLQSPCCAHWHSTPELPVLCMPHRKSLQLAGWPPWENQWILSYQDSVSKNNVNGGPQSKISNVVLWLPQTHAHMCPHTYTHGYLHILHTFVFSYKPHTPKKKRKVLIHTTTWMNLQYIMLRKRSCHKRLRISWFHSCEHLDLAGLGEIQSDY